MQKSATQAPPVAAPTDTHAGGGVFSVQNTVTGLVALAGAFGFATVARWAWVSFIRPGVDAFVFEAMKRQRNEVEAHLRREVFKEDIDARDSLNQQIAEALQIAQEAAASIEVVRMSQDEINEKLAKVVPVCESFERMEARLEKIDARADKSANALERILGRLDERDRWDGIFRRSTDPQNQR